jgi:threonine/homoserine/homoserine lactone efflux protein
MLQALLPLAFIHLLAVMSPGPDFAITTRNSLIHGRSAGIMTAAGIVVGNLIHIAYCIAGLVFLLESFSTIRHIITLAGSAYIVWFGFRCLYAAANPTPDGVSPEGNTRAFFMNGFLANITNAKAILYYLALFSQFITAESSFEFRLILGAEMTLITALWFGGVALALTGNRIRHAFLARRRYIDGALGAVILVFGFRMIVSVIVSLISA